MTKDGVVKGEGSGDCGIGKIWSDCFIRTVREAVSKEARSPKIGVSFYVYAGEACACVEDRIVKEDRSVCGKVAEIDVGEFAADEVACFRKLCVAEVRFAVEDASLETEPGRDYGVCEGKSSVDRDSRNLDEMFEGGLPIVAAP